jgi:hypothetical protein
MITIHFSDVFEIINTKLIIHTEKSLDIANNISMAIKSLKNYSKWV